MVALLRAGEDPCKEDQVGRGGPEAALLYCNTGVVREILKAVHVKRGQLDSNNKKLLLDLGTERTDWEEVRLMISTTGEPQMCSPVAEKPAQKKVWYPNP